MFQAISMVVSVAVIITCFFSMVWAWIILATTLVLMLGQIYITRVQYRAKPQPELSARANELFKRYAHFYAMPFGSKDFAGVATTFAITGIIVAIIGSFYHFYWGLLFGVVNLISETSISRFFIPNHFIPKKSYQKEHEEILALLESRRVKDKR